MDRDASHLLDIITSARMICRYLKGVERNEFMKNVQLQDSVIRRLGIIGEAAGRVSTRFREQNATIPWAQMIGMRNRTIHGYDAVDLDIVWTTHFFAIVCRNIRRLRARPRVRDVRLKSPKCPEPGQQLVFCLRALI